MNISARMKALAMAACLAATSLAAPAAEPARSADAQSAPAAVSPATYLALLASARIPGDAAAVIVRPLDGGALSWDANASKPMNPASTMKLVTTYSALHLLGPAFTFRTEVL